jgi:hypothetical protein
MVGNTVKMIAASLVALGTFGAPAVGSAQSGFGYVDDDQLPESGERSKARRAR